MNNEYESITLELKAIGERALLLSDGDVEEWVPISQIDNIDPEYLDVGMTYDFDIKTWILEEKGFV